MNRTTTERYLRRTVPKEDRAIDTIKIPDANELLNEGERIVGTVLANRDGVRWVKAIPQNGKSKIMVATCCNTAKIRKLLSKRFREQIASSPSTNGFEIVTTYSP